MLYWRCLISSVGERLVEEILTAEEVADYLRVHLMTVRRWCREGVLPAAKVGRAYRIKKLDLDRWWEERSGRGESRVSNHDSEGLRQGNRP